MQSLYAAAFVGQSTLDNAFVNRLGTTTIQWPWLADSCAFPLEVSRQDTTSLWPNNAGICVPWRQARVSGSPAPR